MPLTALIHVTAAYSNAVLVAVLPHVTDVAKRLDLPIAQPITFEQVARFNTSSLTENVGGALWLTNHYWFVFSFGCVDSFRSPDNWFTNQEMERAKRFVGIDNMTTNDAIDFARTSFMNLGYNLSEFKLNEQPTAIEGPFEIKSIGHVPYCRVVWKSPEATTREERAKSYSVQFDIDMQRKQVVGMSLAGTNFWRPQPVIDIQTESESDYRKRMQINVHTNVPAHLNTGAPPNILRKSE